MTLNSTIREQSSFQLFRNSTNPTDLIVANHHSSTVHPSPVYIDDLHICKVVLYQELVDTSIRIWDFIIFVPNLIFLTYLIWHSRVAKERVRQLKNFPILRNFYIFIYLCVIISMLRCMISSLMKVRTFGGDLTDKIFWVIVRFFLLSTEISVLVFGLFAGHLDVRQSIRRILTTTLIVSLVYSICQGSFEIISPDASFYIHSKSYYLFGHGGMIFWFGTCFLSFFIYLIVVLLPWSPCRHRLLLPTKRSFYFYAATLSLLNLIQAIGALLFYLNIIEGLCIVDATTYLYFTLFTPLVYFIFLSPFLAAGGSTSAASALVTTTAGSESSGHNLNRPVVPLARPTNLFNAGLRGAVNFSYRPQIDDELDNDDEFASSIGSFTGGGLHFDHYGPYAYNGQQRQGSYLIYGGPQQGAIPRDFSSFSMQSTTTPQDAQLLDNQHLDNGFKKNPTMMKIKSPLEPASISEEEVLPAKDRLLESQIMLQEQKSKINQSSSEGAELKRSTPSENETKVGQIQSQSPSSSKLTHETSTT